MTSRGHEFTAEETAELLADLDERLRARGLAAAVSWSAVPHWQPTTATGSG